MKNKDFLECLADNLVNTNKELKEDFLTGEKNIVLTKTELEEKILTLQNGKSYLGVLEVEGTILRAQGVIGAEFKHEKIIFNIPDWDSFISRVNAFHVACGPY